MAASSGTSRFAVTCALLRQYKRKHQGQTAGDLGRLFQGSPPPPPVAPEDEDDRTMQLFPVRASMSQERPEVTTDKAAPTAIFCQVPQQEEQAQMRAASLHRFLKRRKVRMSDDNPDNDDDSTAPAKKHKDAAAGKPVLDVLDPSWFSL